MTEQPPTCWRFEYSRRGIERAAPYAKCGAHADNRSDAPKAQLWSQLALWCGATLFLPGLILTAFAAVSSEIARKPAPDQRVTRRRLIRARVGHASLWICAVLFVGV